MMIMMYGVTESVDLVLRSVGLFARKIPQQLVIIYHLVMKAV